MVGERRHAAQPGADRPARRGGVAIDEHTALVVGEGALAVLGTGNVWRVEPQTDDDGEIVGVSVGTLGVE